MKANYNIGILSAILLASLPLNAQISDNHDNRNNDAGTVINNYYDDYSFSSRISRFHRSYNYFDYYAPVFTDPYWYNYQPYSWGLNIYGGIGFGFGLGLGLSFNYPVYNYGYGYGFNYGGYNPYFGSSFYTGYDPFYCSWYPPVIFNFGICNRWPNYYYGWHNYNHGYYDYRPIHYSQNSINNFNHNDYKSTRYSPSQNSSERRPLTSTRSTEVNTSGRDNYTASTARNTVGSNRPKEQSNNGIKAVESRRDANPTATRGPDNVINQNNRDDQGNGKIENRNFNNGNRTYNNSSNSNTNGNRNQVLNPVQRENNSNVKNNTGNSGKSVNTAPARRVREQSLSGRSSASRNLTAMSQSRSSSSKFGSISSSSNTSASKTQSRRK